MKINFVGDLVLQHPDKITIGENLKRCLKQSQYNIVNFEAPIKSNDVYAIPKSGPNIHQSPQNSSWLHQYKFNIIALANNHIMDYGETGLNVTLNTLKDFKHIGAGTWNEAYKPLILEDEEVKIAIFSMAELQFGILYEEEIQGKGCAWINHPSVNDIIKNIKKEVDYVIIIAHAGLEGEELPLPEWRKRYRELIDTGADVIIGGHTHTSQGYEIYKERLIFYSLGNFVFEKGKTTVDKKWNIGELVSLKINKNALSFELHGTSFDGNSIELMDKEDWCNYINKLNEKLSNHYLEQINKICNQKMDDYNNLFSMGGHIHIDKRIFKSIIRYLLGRCNELHTLNNLQCETHRWVISRAIRNNIKK